jgi:ribosome-associated heat shock protein Hsp15
MAKDKNPESVRLDKWLWAARFFKTRSLAAKAIGGGKVQVNGRRPKPASALHLGDRVRVRKGPFEFHVLVRRTSEHRGPASEAATLYEETAQSVQDRERLSLLKKAEPKFEFRDRGRPSKKERRQLQRLKRQPPE